MTRGPVVGSTLIHVGIVAGLLIVRSSAPVIVPGPDIVQVSLVDPQMKSIAVPTPPPPRPERIPDVAPTDEEGLRLEKPKPTPKKEEPPPEEPQKPERANPAALPYASVGPQGLKGEIDVDAADFEFTYYLMLVRNRIAQNWTPPGNGQGVRSVVYFKIGRNGAIASPRLEQPSGVEFFDRAALRAVVVSDPLPPLPLGWSGSELGVHFGFEYTGP